MRDREWTALPSTAGRRGETGVCGRLGPPHVVPALGRPRLTLHVAARDQTLHAAPSDRDGAGGGLRVEPQLDGPLRISAAAPGGRGFPSRAPPPAAPPPPPDWAPGRQLCHVRKTLAGCASRDGVCARAVLSRDPGVSGSSVRYGPPSALPLPSSAPGCRAGQVGPWRPRARTRGAQRVSGSEQWAQNPEMGGRARPGSLI